ncbi:MULTISPECIES: helix-turn-helix domain-containing protein [Thermomonosporaceae]|uniref:helix-turn-helix domain-containing protein n=1 Tax=Thermomonosporaceae TaxID=2012 RepID=UPI00255B117A|nr:MULTISPECIES: helix-turn-helix transcriptional regulator [Thermomonosporaceae]MDL4777469.1 helix-turn-helix transcriptional regulator [Actinomadura xylanilytica]
MPASVPTIRSRWLGAALLKARKDAGLTLDEAAGRLDWQTSKISRIENGLARAHWGDVHDMLNAYAVTDPDRREALTSLAKSLRERNWWRGYGARLDPPFADFLSLEGAAQEMSTYQPQVVPGLLQTRDYALAMVGSSRLWEDPEAAGRFVDVRIGRQAVLTRPSPLKLRAVVGEAALRQQVGGREVMDGQLRHLQRAAELPNVTVQVLPFAAGSATGMFGPFGILTFKGQGVAEVVFLENLVGGLYLEEDDEIHQYRLACRHLRASALSPKQSLRLVADVLKETNAS